MQWEFKMAKSKQAALKLPAKFDRNYIYILSILTVTLIVFLPSLFNDFTLWDDNMYISENSKIKILNWENVLHIFTSTHGGGYEPFTELSFAIEYHFFKLNPFIYHFNNLMLHLINCALVYILIFLLSKKKFISFLSALFWGIHPMRVESVAWVSERKDVLFTMFFLISLITYIIYLDKKKLYLYIISTASFFLCLLPKAQGIMLPFVLILLDYFLGRKINLKAFINKIPYFLISILFLLILFMGSKETGQITRLPFSAMLQNFLYANFGLVFYLLKFILPFNLSANYPLPDKFWGMHMKILYFISPLITFILAFLIFLSGKTTKKIIFAGLFYFINLLIVLQLTRTSLAVVGDRYTYIPYIALSYLTVDSLVILFSKLKNKFHQISLTAVTLIIFLLFSILTWNQTKVWKNNFTLWHDAVKKNPDNTITAANYAVSLIERDDLEQAEIYNNKAIEIDPSNSIPYINLAHIFIKRNQPEKAVEIIDKLIIANPNYYRYRYKAGLFYMQINMNDKALSEFEKAIEFNPIDSASFNAIGSLYFKQRRFEESEKYFTKAINLSPDQPEAFCNLGNIHFELGNFDEALKLYKRSIKASPGFEEPYVKAGIIYENMNLLKEAGYYFKTALEINPDLITLYSGLGAIYARTGLYKKAFSVWKKGLKLDPGNENIKYNIEQLKKFLP
jgi:tetratricopeptide (TPR) repeat protein